MRFAITWLWVAMCAAVAPWVGAYPVAPPLPLVAPGGGEQSKAKADGGASDKTPSAQSQDSLLGMADVVVKATVVDVRRVSDSLFQAFSGYGVQQTCLQVISVLKINGEGKHHLPQIIEFRHYAKQGAAYLDMGPAPQMYDLRMGQHGIFFLKTLKAPQRYQPLWVHAHGKDDQGVVRCREGATVEGTSVTLVVWNELVKLTASEKEEEAIYGIEQLAAMSGCGSDYRTTQDFDKGAALKVIAPLLRSKSERVQMAAVQAVGASSPWMGERREEFWLASLPGSNIRGLGTVGLENREAGALWTELARIVETATSETLRGAAMRALGNCREAKLYPYVCKWSGLQATELRANATQLLAAYTTQTATRSLLETLLNDHESAVRIAAANAVAGGHLLELLPRLEDHLTTGTQGEREAFAQAILALPIDEIRPTLERHVDDEGNVGVAFVNVLGSKEPAKYADRLAGIVKEGKADPLGGGGEIPAYAAWRSLERWLRVQDAAVFKERKFDKILDAMEQSNHSWSSSQPRNLYAILIAKGMTERAEKFRAHEKQVAHYEVDYFFDEAKQNPGNYMMD